MHCTHSNYNNLSFELTVKITIYIYIYIYMPIGIMVSVFAKGPEKWGLITVRVIPKALKMVLDASLLDSIIRYGSRLGEAIQGKE